MFFRVNEFSSKYIFDKMHFRINGFLSKCFSSKKFRAKFKLYYVFNVDVNVDVNRSINSQKCPIGYI